MGKNRIAILGGAGFVGSRLSSRFREHEIEFDSYDVNTVCSSQNFSYLDIENLDSLDQLAGKDTIINLAAVHRDDVRPLSRYDDVNVQGSVNVCKAARKYGVRRIIFTSSVAIYGFAPPDTDENGEPNFFNDYGRTKFLAEQVYKEWQSEAPDERSLVIVRPTVIFGEGNRGNVYNLLRQIASGKFVMFGDGENRKSMAYVENVASFLEFCLSSKPGLHIYNYVDKPDYDMNSLIQHTREILLGKDGVGLRLPAKLGMAIGHLADLVAKIAGTTLPISSIRVKKFMGTTQFATSVAETGFIAEVSLEDGLEKTIKFEFLEDNSDQRTFDTE